MENPFKDFSLDKLPPLAEIIQNKKYRMWALLLATGMVITQMHQTKMLFDTIDDATTIQIGQRSFHLFAAQVDTDRLFMYMSLDYDRNNDIFFHTNSRTTMSPLTNNSQFHSASISTNGEFVISSSTGWLPYFDKYCRLLVRNDVNDPDTGADEGLYAKADCID